MHQNNGKKVESVNLLRKVAAILICAYMIAVVVFYFLAGDQLHLRESRGDLNMLPADSGTVELYAGSVVEQQFKAEIQRLEQIDIQWGTYYRPNFGNVVIDLLDLRDGSVILSQSFDVAAIPEGGLTTLIAESPIEGVYNVPLLLRITSPDSQSGSAASPMMNTQETLEDALLMLNGTPTQGVLCFAVRGTDYIWTGLHYWEFAVAGLALILVFLIAVCYRYRSGKRSYVVNAVIAIQKYKFLIRQLVVRDFKTKYKRSILGVFWSFLNPLLTMSVQYIVFATIFKADVPNYPSYLLIGIVTFSFFTEACGMSLTSIVGNSGLITKVYMPKYIYPLTRVMSSVVNLAISLIPLLIVCLFTGVRFEKSAILAIYFLLCVVVFSLGFGLVLATSMVFFRDTQFLWSVLSMIWMYLTPIFYPESILPPELKVILYFNPLYHFIKSERMCILDAISPEPVVYVQCFLMAMCMLTFGALIFRKNQDRFVLYL